MIINHVSLYTQDLEKMRLFYEKYFNGASGKKYHNVKTGLETYFVKFGEGASLEIMYRPEIKNNNSETKYCGWAHIAFSTGSKEAVDKLTDTITSDGYKLYSAPRTTGDGFYESCVSDPDGNQIEIVE